MAALVNNNTWRYVLFAYAAALAGALFLRLLVHAGLPVWVPLGIFLAGLCYGFFILKRVGYASLFFEAGLLGMYAQFHWEGMLAGQLWDIGLLLMPLLIILLAARTTGKRKPVT